MIKQPVLWKNRRYTVITKRWHTVPLDIVMTPATTSSFVNLLAGNLFQMKPTRCTLLLSIFISTSLHVWPASWSSGQSFWLLITRSRVRFPALPWEFSLKGKIPRSEHGLGRLVEFMFKAPPSTTSSSITTHTPSGQRNCASWASQPQKSGTLLQYPGGRTTKSTKDMWRHWGAGRWHSWVCGCVGVRRMVCMLPVSYFCSW